MTTIYMPRLSSNSAMSLSNFLVIHILKITQLNTSTHTYTTKNSVIQTQSSGDALFYLSEDGCQKQTIEAQFKGSIKHAF